MLLKIFSKPIFINIIVFSFLVLLCFYQYSGFQKIFWAYTQDYIPMFVGSEYILSHPSFMFLMQVPHFHFLATLFSLFLYLITNGTGWLIVLIVLFIHVVNAFILFRITLFLTNNKIFPSLIASSFFITSIIFLDSLLNAAHCHAVVASLFGLLSFFFFLKVFYAGSNYKREYLFYSFLLCLFSITIYDCYIGLPLVYFSIMLIRIRSFKKDFFIMLFITSVYFIMILFLRHFLQQVYNINIAPSISFNLLKNIRDHNYSFTGLTAHFFYNFLNAIAFLSGGNVNYQYNKYFSLFIFFMPLIFLKRGKILGLYSLLIIMWLLFIPYFFSRIPLNDRHISQIAPFTGLYVALLINSSLAAINKIKIKALRRIIHLTLGFFILTFIFKYSMVAKKDVKDYINNNSSYSQIMKKFTNEFKKVKVPNPKKQIYFLKSEIPREHTFLHNEERVCYAIFYFAAKYKKLPIDLYLQVYRELECGMEDEEICKDYYTDLPDGSCFGLYRDKEKLLKLINGNSGVTLGDIIVLNWRNNELKYEDFE